MSDLKILVVRDPKESHETFYLHVNAWSESAELRVNSWVLDFD